MEPANLPITTYEQVYGSLYFSSLMSTGLYGVTCMQTFYFYVHYPDDSLRMKIFVAVLWALDTIHEALTVAGVYRHIIAVLIDPLSILDADPEIALQLFSENLVVIPVQAFFVYRIYLFSGKNIVAPLLWVLQAIAKTVVVIVYVAKAFYSLDGTIHVVGTLVLTDKFFVDLSTTTVFLNAAVDILIAIVMTYLLLRTRNTPRVTNSTTHVLRRLTVFAVNTGIWTATLALLALILLRVLPASSFELLPGIPLSSLYCNTLLANLNARAYIRHGEITPMFDGTKVERLSTIVFNAPPNQTTMERETFSDAPAAGSRLELVDEEDD